MSDILYEFIDIKVTEQIVSPIIVFAATFKVFKNESKRYGSCN